MAVLANHLPLEAAALCSVATNTPLSVFVNSHWQDDFKVYVSTLTFKIFELWVASKTTVEEAKQLFASKEGELAT